MTGREAKVRLPIVFGLVACLLTLAAGVDPDIVGLSKDQWHSCDLPPDFKILTMNEDAVNNWKCVFITSSGESQFDISQQPAPAEADYDFEITCLLNAFFDAGTILPGIRSDGVFFPAPSNITILDSPISAESSEYTNIDVATAGDSVIFQIVPIPSECDVIVSTCEQDGLQFTFDFPSMEDQPIVTTLERDGLACLYSVNLTTAGSFPFTIFYNATEGHSGNLTINPSTSISSVLSIMDTSTLTGLKAGVQACFDVTVHDIYNNLVPNRQVSMFNLEWRDDFTSAPVEGLFLDSTTDGVYTLCFIPNRAGTQILGLQISLSEPSGSPYEVEISPGDFDPESSKPVDFDRCDLFDFDCPLSSTERGLTVAFAGKPAYFIILLMDEYGNWKTSSPEVDPSKFNVTFVQETDDNPIIVKGTVSAGPTGAYVNVTYTPGLLTNDDDAPLVYTLLIDYDGVPVSPSSVISVNFLPGTVSSSASSLVNDSDVTVSAGVSFDSTLRAFDDFGNVAVHTTLTAKVLIPSGDDVDCSVSESELGEYTATCLVTLAGTWTLQFFFEGTPIDDTRQIIVVPTNILGSNSQFEWNFTNPVVNENYTIYIHTRDTYGNVGGVQSALFRTQLIGLNDTGKTQTITASTFVSGNTYTVTWSTLVAGEYMITVSYLSQSLVTNMPSTTFSVAPGPLSGEDCFATPYLPMIASTPVRFNITSRDAFRNVLITWEPERFAMNLVSDSRTVEGVITNTATPGVYLATFDVAVADAYSALGMVDDVLSFTSTAVVAPGPTSTETSTFTPQSTGQTSGVAGVKSYVYIQGRDSRGNPLSSAVAYDVYLMPASRRRDDERINCTQETSNDFLDYFLNGISVYSYTVNASGIYFLHAEADGQPLAGTPTQLKMASAPATLGGHKLSGPATSIIEQEFTYELTLYDSFGNAVQGNDVVQADLIGNGFPGLVSGSADFDAARRVYLFKFKPTLGGPYTVSVVVNSALRIDNTTVDVFTTFGGGCTKFTDPINQDQRWTIICTAYDQYGWDKVSGNSDVVEYEAPDGNVVMTSYNDGRYGLSYASPSIGQHELTVTINGKICRDMPLTVIVIPGAVVLGTVIPALFIAGVIIAVLVIYLKRRKVKHEQLLKKKRKPEQVFPVNDYEEEWSDSGSDLEQGEEWFIDQENLNEEDKLRHAHEIAMKELQR